jgi:hypothetical protein
MNEMPKIGWPCVLAVFLAGCAMLGQPAQQGGDYSETQLGPDVFRIFPPAAGDASPEKAQDLLLLRAADLCKQRGYKFFAVIAKTDQTTDQTDYITYVPDESSVPKPDGGLLIQTFPEKPDKIFSFDAAFLRRSLREKYGMPADPADQAQSGETAVLEPLYPDERPATPEKGDHKPSDGLRPLYPDDNK